MPIRVCLDPHCPNPATWRGRCREHARTNDRQIKRAGYRLYRSARWRRTRRAYLFAHPLCALCGHIATDVHHRIDLADGGQPYDARNLQSLCHPCHSQLTRAAQA